MFYLSLQKTDGAVIRNILEITNATLDGVEDWRNNNVMTEQIWLVWSDDSRWDFDGLQQKLRVKL